MHMMSIPTGKNQTYHMVASDSCRESFVSYRVLPIDESVDCSMAYPND